MNNSTNVPANSSIQYNLLVLVLVKQHVPNNSPVLLSMPLLLKSLSTMADMKPAVRNAEKTNIKPIPRMWILYRFLFILSEYVLQRLV